MLSSHLSVTSPAPTSRAPAAADVDARVHDDQAATRAVGAEPGVYGGQCPARALLDRIADKWTMLVVGLLAEAQAPVRFSVLRRSIAGISQKMLTQTLRDLERDGLVVRRAYAVIPPRVEYSLTDLGATLQEPMQALSAWSERHMAEVRIAQQRFDANLERATLAI